MAKEVRPLRGETLLKGTFILTLAGIVVKVIGSLNWIFVSRVLGGEGIGLYQMAFPIYFFAFSLSTAGVPVAISIITAERVALKDVFGARRVFRISLYLMLATGLLFSLLTYFGADWLIRFGFIRDSRAYYSVIALAPAIFFVTLLASSRGYLQGWQRMTPTAVSQIVEQVFRVITMIMLANYFLPYGLQFASMGASMGAGMGAVAGLVPLAYYHWRLNRDIAKSPDFADALPTSDAQPAGKILRRLFQLALPVSAASIMLPVVSNLDLIIVPQRLEVAGYSVPQATELFGYLTGMAVPLINLSTIITASLAVSIIPALSEARALKNDQLVAEHTAAGIRLSHVVCFPAFVVVCMLARPIATLIYNAPGAGDVVWALSFSIVLLGLHQVSTGVLQGIGHPTIPMVTMILAAVAKVVLNWTLTAMPALGILGASFATAADMGVAALLNMYFIRRYVGYRVEWRHLGKVAVSSALMAAVLRLTYDGALAVNAGAVPALMLALLTSAFVYLGAMYITGGLTADDLAHVPMFNRLRNFLKR